MLYRNNGMKCKFIITRMGKIGETDIAYGDFYIISGDKLLFQCPARSGGWGKGELETGEYIIDWYNTPEEIAKHKNRDAYSYNNFGFYFHLEPKFKTDRNGIGIHLVGKTIGTLGCCELEVKDIIEAESIYSLLSSAMMLYKSIKFYAERVLNQRESWDILKK